MPTKRSRKDAKHAHPNLPKPGEANLNHGASLTCRIDSNSTAVNQIKPNANAYDEAELSGAACGDNPPIGIA